MNYKKLLSIVLVFTMLSIYMTCAPVSAEEIQYDNVEIKLLRNLNIINVSETNTDFSLDGDMTRGQFALYLARLLMLDDTGVGGEDYFIDVPKEHYAYTFVKVLTDLNIISKNSSKMFYPDEVITYEQALKMLVASLGYHPHAVAKGGYPFGYIIVANELGIIKNNTGSIGKSLSKTDALKMIFGALDVPMVKVDLVSDDSVTFSEDSNKTLLSMRDIYLYEGQVNQIAETSLTSSVDELKEDEVKVGSLVFKVGTTNAKNLLGEYIKFYYKEIDDEVYEMLFITEYESKVLVIPADKIIDYKNSTYYYEVRGSDNEYEETLEQGFDIIYNKKVPKNFNISYMKPESGSVKIIRNSSGNGSNVVIISEYENYVVSNIDRKNNKIYSHNSTPLALDSFEYKIYNSLGNIISFESIKEFDVLSVYKSDDNKYIDIYVASSQEDGVVEAISHDGESAYIYLNNVEYKLDKSVTTPDVGAEVTAYFDIDKNIAWIETKSDTLNDYGYLLALGKANRGTLNPDLNVRLLTTNGKVETFAVNEKLKINDRKINNFNEAETRLNNIEKKVVKYKLNDKRELISIYVYDSSSDNYIRHMGKGRYKYNTKQQTFSGTITLEDNAIVFVIPADAKEDDDYSVGTKSTFANDKFFEIDAYTFGDTEFTQLVIRGSSTITYEKTLSVVTGIKYIRDEEDETRIKLSVLSGGVTQDYLLKANELLGTVEKGDVVRIALSLNNEIESILHVYDKNAEKYLLDNPYQPESSNGYFSNNRVIYGNVYSMENALMKFTTMDPSLSKDKLTFENCLADKFTVYVYANDGKTCSMGSYQDLIGYSEAPEGYSKVIVATNWGDPTDIIILN